MTKVVKKLMCLLLALVTCLSCMGIMASAAEKTVINSYGAEESYTVTIPAKMTTVSEDDDPEIAEVSAKDVIIPYGKMLCVRVDYDNYLELDDNKEISLHYSLFREEEEDTLAINTGDTVLNVKAGDTEERTAEFYSVTDETPIYSGNYTDRIIFSVSVEEQATDYTEEEITAANRRYGIGKNKREYVVAEFNEDFTECVITKNGEDSDGIMLDWTKNSALVDDYTEYLTENPMYQNRSTITSVEIKDGVQNVGDLALPYLASLDGVMEFPNSVEEIGMQAFYNDKSLDGVSFGNGVRNIKDHAFYNCINLAGALDLTGTTEFIGNYAFDSLEKITSLTLGNKVGFIGSCAFQCCTGIENEIVLPDSLIVIGDFAFNQLTKAANTKLVIPKNVKHIGGTCYSKPLTGFDGITLNNQRVGAVPGATASDYVINAFEPGDAEYLAEGYTIDNYKTAAYANSGSHVFFLFGNATNMSFEVSSENTAFKAIDGVLYTKDGKRLVGAGKKQTLVVPEGVEFIDELSITSVSNLTLPDSYEIQTFPDAPVTQINYQNTLHVALYRIAPGTKISVSETNPRYKVINNSLYSKDGKVCYHLWMDANGVGTIADGCERTEGISTDVKGYNNLGRATYTLNIPASVKFISNYDSTTYTGEGDIDAFNAAVANTSHPMTINIDSGNTVYTTNAAGKIVFK